MGSCICIWTFMANNGATCLWVGPEREVERLQRKVVIGACIVAYSAPMRMPLAATRGAPQKEAMPPTHATASESFTLQRQQTLLR